MSARGAVLGALGKAVEAAPAELLQVASAKLAALTGAGLVLSRTAAGRATREAISAAPSGGTPPPPPPPPPRWRRVRACVDSVPQA